MIDQQEVVEAITLTDLSEAQEVELEENPEVNTEEDKETEVELMLIKKFQLDYETLKKY